jgi:protein-glutamine gamma-glutamyltransferase
MLNHSALTLANITWLLAALSFVIAPHVTRLPLWVTACCIGAGLWRWWIARKGLRAPPWWLMGAIALAITAGAFVEYRRLFGREVGVTLLIVMLCLKILEMKMKRDAMLVIFLSFFLALTNFLYSQVIVMGLYMLVCVWILVATLIGFNRINTEATIRERLVPSAWLLAQALPLMLVLFFLFPRMSGPLWSIPQDDQSISGLSDSMSPGDISKLSLSEAVVFRVDFENAVPQNENLYWRGPVLGQQLGKSWVPYAVSEREKLDYEPQGPLTKYRVTLQPHNKPWLFALDLPSMRPGDSFFLADFQLRSRTPVTALRAYEMASHLNYRVGVDLPPYEKSQYLAIDRRLNPRAIAYGQKLAEEHADQKVLVETLMKLYNTQFTYTLEPPKLGANPMDEFLFDTKQGFCEHYAGSFVLVLRAAGIPSRVVTGYQGGEINPITRQLVVRQSDAHAWSEVWFADLGWVRIDPTFAVSPLRINRGFSAAIGPVGMFNTMMEADKLGLLKQLRYSWDAVNNQWNQWVVGFNNERQKSLMDQLGVKDMDWRTLAIWLIVGIVIASGSVGLFLMLRMYRTRKEPVVTAYEALCAKLSRAGVTRAPHEGPIALLSRVQEKRPKLAQQVAPLFESYVALRYGTLAEPKTNDETTTARQKLREFISAVRRFRIAAQ